MTARAARIAGVLAVLLAIAAVYLAPAGRWMSEFVGSIRSAGPGGAALFALAYVAATVLLLPGAVLTAGAGFAWGPLLGTLLVSPVSVVAATLAFVLGRTVARGWIARRIASSPRFAAIDAAIAERGFRIVLLLRLSPIFPFSLLNYALGLTRVSLRDFVAASALGMLPGTVLYVYLGSIVPNAAELAAGAGGGAGASRAVLYWGGLAATLAATWLVGRTARAALSRAIEPLPVDPPRSAKEVQP